MKFGRKIMTAATLALTAIFNSACDNGPSYTVHADVQIGDNVLPACIARDGTRAVYVSTRTDDSPYAYKMIPGILPPNDNIPSAPGAYIVLPEPFMGRMKDLMAAFVIAHECAHHKLGHTEDSTYAGNDLDLMRQFEAEADCEAVNIMRRHYGMTVKQTMQGIEGFFLFLAQENNDPTYHGTATERHARTLSCLR